MTGKPVKREMIMMGSCNYLGLATQPQVVKAAEEATKKYGTGSEGAALLTGTFDIHKALESKLAEMKSCEDAIIFPTGYYTNLGFNIGNSESAIIPIIIGSTSTLRKVSKRIVDGGPR